MLGLAISIWSALTDRSPGGVGNVILLAGGTAGGVLMAGGAGYIKKAG